jgi:MFS family permease
MVGFYLSAQTLARILSNLLWQRLGRARGNYFLVKTAAFLTALEPLLAVVLPHVMRWVGLTVERTGLMPAYLFTAVFLIVGSSGSGRSIGLMALLLDVAPDEERASYVGFVNTILGFVSFLPIFAGAIIDQVGFEPIFYTTTGLLLLGFLVTLGWKKDQRKPLF